MFKKPETELPVMGVPALTETATEPAASTSRHTSAPRAVASRIGAGSRFEGELTGKGDLVIDGTVEGDVKLDGFKVEVGRAGVVLADIAADRIHVSGQVTGDLNGREEVVLTKLARVEGNIVSKSVTLETGARFRGAVDMQTRAKLRDASESSDADASARARHHSVPSSSEKRAAFGS